MSEVISYWEQELGLSLNGVCSIKVLDLDEVYAHSSFKDENGLHLVMGFEFNFVSIETQAFLVLVEMFLTQFGWDKLYHLSEPELKEKVFEAHLYAGGQANFYNPARPAIEAVKNYMQYLTREEARDFYEILYFLHSELLTPKQERELFEGQYYSSSNSDEAYEASLNGVED